MWVDFFPLLFFSSYFCICFLSFLISMLKWNNNFYHIFVFFNWNCLLMCTLYVSILTSFSSFLSFSFLSHMANSLSSLALSTMSINLSSAGRTDGSRFVNCKPSKFELNTQRYMDTKQTKYCGFLIFFILSETSGCGPTSCKKIWIFLGCYSGRI